MNTDRVISSTARRSQQYFAAMDLREVAHEVMTAGGRHHTPFGLYVLDGRDERAELARAVEREVFLEVFGNTPELLEEEYGPYEDASLFLCVVDHARRTPAGMIRVIESSAAGFKSVHDIEAIWGVDATTLKGPRGVGLDPSSLWDIATLAVASEYRAAASSGLVSMALYQAVNMLGSASQIGWAVAVMDVVVLDLVNSAWHRPFAAVPGTDPRRYLDSPASLPVYCDVFDYRTRLSFLDPSTHAILFEGVGLEAAVSTPEWTRVPLVGEPAGDVATAG